MKRGFHSERMWKWEMNIRNTTLFVQTEHARTCIDEQALRFAAVVGEQACTEQGWLENGNAMGAIQMRKQPKLTN